MGIATDGSQVFFVTGYVDDIWTQRLPRSLISVTGVEEEGSTEVELLRMGRFQSAPLNRQLRTSLSMDRAVFLPNLITSSHLSTIVSMGAIRILGLQELLSSIQPPFLEVVSRESLLQEARVARFISWMQITSVDLLVSSLTKPAVNCCNVLSRK
jgi:hypothetical protein